GGPPGGRRARRRELRPPDAAARAPGQSRRYGSPRARARAAPPRRRAARGPPRRPAARWRPRAPLRRTSSRGVERLRLLARGEGVDDRVELAVEHALERVQREARPVVGDAALREVVGADLLGAVARADHGPAAGGDLRLLLVPRPLEQAGAEDLERLRLVLVLRLLVL